MCRLPHLINQVVAAKAGARACESIDLRHRRCQGRRGRRRGGSGRWRRRARLRIRLAAAAAARASAPGSSVSAARVPAGAKRPTQRRAVGIQDTWVHRAEIPAPSVVQASRVVEAGRRPGQGLREETRCDDHRRRRDAAATSPHAKQKALFTAGDGPNYAWERPLTWLLSPKIA